ncbi:MAG: carbon-nitrogen hydrolase family protein [Dehalogenimonas sp.]|jgi:predicted amidohydrolase|uniref:Carbon-nitrogen hydrolase family protein n=1 Tax=Candidatus Dehalogenimonas loeffleri TaxID=3127115 RepID=A0ABZ2J569_9CHLR|nr:carbon-nitrogen hydrolase family protein [Dehalogenimonas sp.]
MKVAIYQIADTGDADTNITKAYDAITKSEADFFALPEFFAIPGGDYKKQYTLESCYQETGKPAYDMLEKASRVFPGYIIGGSILERDGNCYYNTCYVWKNGDLVTSYRKIKITREEVDLQICPGKDPVTFASPFGQIGLMICADCISWDVVDAVAAGSKYVFLPVSLTDPNHPPFTGHPLSEAIAKKHGATVIKITRMGTFGGKVLASRSAVTTPEGTIWEALESLEFLAEVEI